MQGKAKVDLLPTKSIKLKIVKHKRSPFVLFLQGKAEVDQLPTESIKRIKECYKQMRAVYSAMGAEHAHMHSVEAGVQQDGGLPKSVSFFSLFSLFSSSFFL